MKLKGTFSIVTGASQGMGRAIAEKLATEGSYVAVCDIKEKAAEEVAKHIESSGGKAIAVRVDLTSVESIKQMAATIEERFGRVDILINSAGAQTVNTLFEMTENEWDLIMDVNLKGLFFCTQAIAKIMKKNSSGKIVNIASVRHDLPRLHEYHYDASKAGVVMLTKELALALAPDINVNCIAPGATATPMNQSILDSKQLQEHIITRIPMQRMAKPEDISNLIAFLVSDAAAYITGATITIDGGLSLIDAMDEDKVYQITHKKEGV